MAQGNNFLTIPEQKGLFTTTKSVRSGEDRSNCPEEDEDDEETEDDVRIIPRSSPIPRKRGHSINDETAEYMRIRLVLPPRRVSFADTTGADLVDVREFVPFDSDDEDDARWEEEETKYREAYRKPTYRLWPEFQPLTGNDLVLAVRTNKVEVESVMPLSEEPLSFEGLIRVLNISFQKSVYVRSTMDGWITYFDYPAEYVQGSNDGETDKFTVRLSFAEPYLFNGARIDFVVRYETPAGEFWANNSGRNYSVTLLQLYEETAQVRKVENIDIKGILKPSTYSMQDDSDFSQDKNGGDVAGTERDAVIDVSYPVCPPIVEPEIDIEITEALSSSPPKTSGDSGPAAYTLPSVDAPNEQCLQDSSEISPQPDPPEITDQVTQSLLLTENLTPSIQEVIETKHEVPSSEPSSHSNTSFSPNIDGSQSANVPLNFYITLPAVFPGIEKKTEEVEGNELRFSSTEEVEEMKEVRGNAEKQTEIKGREAQKQEETLNKMEVDTPETSTQQCSLNEGSPDSASKDQDFSCPTYHDTLFGNALYPHMEECEIETVKNDATGRFKASQKEKTRLKVKNVQTGGEEVAELVAACTGRGFGVADLELTGGDIVIHHLSNHPTMPDPEVYLPRRQGSGSETKELAAVPPVDVQASFVSESRADKEEIPTPTPQGKGKEEKLFHDDPVSSETQESQESQCVLSTKTPEVSSAQPDMLLRQILIPPLAFFSAVVCLVVGFQELSAFLVMGLLLVSLCL